MIKSTSPTLDVNALQLESRFSIAPNSLGYCGKDTAPAKFTRCIIDGNCEGVEEEVTKFIVLYPYLKTIAAITELPIFSYPVIESYWLGNELLKKAKLKDYNLLLENFLKQGVPEWFVKQLQVSQPKQFIPSHLFQVLHVGVGKASGAVPFNLDSINSCMIRWGKVLKIDQDRLTVSLYSLKEEGKGYSLITIEEELPFALQLVPQLKVEDTVAVHWKQVIKILTAEEEEKLIYWTKEVLRSFA